MQSGYRYTLSAGETLRTIAGILLSPFAVCWFLITDRHSRWLPVCASYMFAPVAMCWQLVTRRDLVVQVRSFTYDVSRMNRWLTEPARRYVAVRCRLSEVSDIERQRIIAKWKPHYQFGPVDVLKAHPFMKDGRDDLYFERITVRLFAKGSEDYRTHAQHQGHVSFGALNVGIWRCEDERTG